MLYRYIKYVVKHTIRTYVHAYVRRFIQGSGMYVHTYIRMYIVFVCMYIHTLSNHKVFQPVASSVITAIPILMCSPVASQLYNITVTCTIHPDSTADQCVVMAMADGRVTRTGELHTMTVIIFLQ